MFRNKCRKWKTWTLVETVNLWLERLSKILQNRKTSQAQRLVELILWEWTDSMQFPSNSHDFLHWNRSQTNKTKNLLPFILKNKDFNIKFKKLLPFILKNTDYLEQQYIQYIVVPDSQNNPEQQKKCWGDYNTRFQAIFMFLPLTTNIG